MYSSWGSSEVGVPVARPAAIPISCASMGIAARRWWRKRSRTTVRPGRARSGSPTPPRTWSATLSGQSACTRDAAARAASTPTSGGNGAYSTLTAPSASATSAGLSAMTAATGSPT